MSSVEPKSGFFYADGLAVRVDKVVLILHMVDETTLDVWMPRSVTDTLTRPQLQQIADVVQYFIAHVPRRPA